MLPYIFIIIPFLLSTFLPRLAYRKIAIYISLLGLIIFCGTRVGTGNDYYSYEDIYQSVGFPNYDESIEFLSFKLILLFKFIGFEFEIFLLFFTFLIISTILYGMRFYFRNCTLPVIIFILNDMPILLMSVIRQGLAVGLILIGSNLLMEKKFLSSAAFFIAAILFHSASVFIVAIVLISYIINKIRINRIAFILIFLCSSVSIVISNKFDFFSFTSAKYDVYSSNFIEDNNPFIFGGYFIFKLILFF